VKPICLAIAISITAGLAAGDENAEPVGIWTFDGSNEGLVQDHGRYAGHGMNYGSGGRGLARESWQPEYDRPELAESLRDRRKGGTTSRDNDSRACIR